MEYEKMVFILSYDGVEETFHALEELINTGSLKLQQVAAEIQEPTMGKISRTMTI